MDNFSWNPLFCYSCTRSFFWKCKSSYIKAIESGRLQRPSCRSAFRLHPAGRVESWAQGSPMINDERVRGTPGPLPPDRALTGRGTRSSSAIWAAPWPALSSPLRRALCSAFSGPFGPALLLFPPVLPVYVKRPACTSLPLGKRGLAFLWSLCG